MGMIGIAGERRFDVLEQISRKSLQEGNIVRVGSSDYKVLYNGTSAALIRPQYGESREEFLSEKTTIKVTVEPIP